MTTKNFFIGVTLVCIVVSGYAHVTKDYGTVIGIDLGTICSR
jgi:hypothetical protein